MSHGARTLLSCLSGHSRLRPMGGVRMCPVPYPPGPPGPPPQESHRWEGVAAVAGCLSAFAAAAALLVSCQSLTISQSAQNLATAQQRQQIASRVYVSEAPHYAYVHEAPPLWTAQTTGQHRTGYVVLNASNVPVTSVWVEGRGGTSIDIRVLQGCSMYALPPGFRPVAVDFRDPYAHWRRALGGQPYRRGRPIPAHDTGESPWWGDVQNCS